MCQESSWFAYAYYKNNIIKHILWYYQSKYNKVTEILVLYSDPNKLLELIDDKRIKQSHIPHPAIKPNKYTIFCTIATMLYHVGYNFQNQNRINIKMTKNRIIKIRLLNA